MTYVNDADLSDWGVVSIYQMKDFFNRMMRELCIDQGGQDLWYEWISDGASLHDKFYKEKPYTQEEYQKACQKAKLLAGPYGRVIILAWLQSRKSDNG